MFKQITMDSSQYTPMYTGESNQMESYMSFLFVTDAANYIHKYNLNATIQKNKRTGRYDVIRTYVSALVGKVMEMED